MYTKEDLKLQLDCMNIQNNDTVLIHTSMKAIGPVEGGAVSVIAAKKCQEIILRIFERAEEDIFTDFCDIPVELYRD